MRRTPRLLKGRSLEGGGVDDIKTEMFITSCLGFVHALSGFVRYVSVPPLDCISVHAEFAAANTESSPLLLLVIRYHRFVVFHDGMNESQIISYGIEVHEQIANLISLFADFLIAVADDGPETYRPL